MRNITCIALAACISAFLSCQNTLKQTTESTATNWTLGPFTKVDSANPVLTPGTARFTDPILNKSVGWEVKFVYNPAAVVKDDKVYLIYRAEDSIGKYNGTSRLGLAQSTDGIHFSRLPEPVLYPTNGYLKSI